MREAQDKLIVKRLRASVDPGPSEELEQLRREYKLARFVQIGTSVSVDEHGALEENLYALDSQGRVWWYSFKEWEWNRLNGERVEP